MIDFELEKEWLDLLARLSGNHGEKPDIQAILFLVGVQELNAGLGQTFSKDEKVDLLHVGICTVLEPYGYYKFIGRDSDGWPHFENIKKLPPLNEEQQQFLMKKAVLEYFTES